MRMPGGSRGIRAEAWDTEAEGRKRVRGDVGLSAAVRSRGSEQAEGGKPVSALAGLGRGPRASGGRQSCTRERRYSIHVARAGVCRVCAEVLAKDDHKRQPYSGGLGERQGEGAGGHERMSCRMPISACTRGESMPVVPASAPPARCASGIGSHGTSCTTRPIRRRRGGRGFRDALGRPRRCAAAPRAASASSPRPATATASASAALALWHIAYVVWGRTTPAAA
jgi:hypothetical protein